jgi:hypothetical protein
MNNHEPPFHVGEVIADLERLGVIPTSESVLTTLNRTPQKDWARQPEAAFAKMRTAIEAWPYRAERHAEDMQYAHDIPPAWANRHGTPPGTLPDVHPAGPARARGPRRAAAYLSPGTAATTPPTHSRPGSTLPCCPA